MVPIVAGYPTDTAADALGEPIILTGTEQVTIASEHVLADRRHLARRQARVDVEIFERPVEPGDMIGEAKGLAVEAAGHVENGIAAQKALVAERDLDLALAHDLAVEPGDAFVAEGHRSLLLRGSGSLGGLRHRYPVEVLGQSGLGDGAMLDNVRQGAGDELADRNQPLDVDPGLEPHRLEHEGEILGDDVAGGARRVGAASEPAQRGVEGACAGVQRRQHVGEAEPTGIVEMAGNRQRCHISDDAAENTLDCCRLAVADGVGEDDRIRTGLGDLDGDMPYPFLVDGTLDRAAERGGEPARDPRAPLGWSGVTERHDAAEILDRLAGGAAYIRAIVTLADR